MKLVEWAGRQTIRQMTTASELTIDEGLLRRIVAGDEAAFTLLYRRKHPAIYRLALHMSGNTSIAEDVTQEVFMTLIRDAKRFDPARGTLSSYLFGVARNQVLKRWEQSRRLVPLPDDSGHSETSNGRNGSYEKIESGVSAYRNGNGAYPAGYDEFASRETIGRVRQAIGTLPENYREVVVLCELEEMSYEDAARALDCPVGTVRSRLHRARTILLEKLREPQRVRRASAVGE